MIEAVAGLLDEDDPETCARREALEEAGVVVKVLERVSAAYGICAFVTEILTIFIGTYDDKDRQRGCGLALSCIHRKPVAVYSG